MSLVEGTSALQYTNEVANTLKVVSETTNQSAEIYSISNYLSETQADQAQAAMTTYTYVESLKTYVPQVVTGLTATAGGAYTAVSGGVAYVLSAPVAFAAMAGALGIGLGVGMYQVNPEFWTKVSNALVDAGKIVGNGVLGFMKDGKTYIPSSTINIVRQLLLEEGAYNAGDPGYSSDLNCSPWTQPILETTAPINFSKSGSLWNLLSVSEGVKVGLFRSELSNGDWRIVLATPYNNSTYTYQHRYGTTTSNVGSNYFDHDSKRVYYTAFGPGTSLKDIDSLQSGNTYNYANSTDVGYNSHLAWTLLYGTQSGGGGVEGLEKESGATYPSEQSDIPTEYPDWWLSGMDFLKPVTREIGNNPTLNPDDYETEKALPLEIPATIGSPIEVGYEEPQVTIQGGVITAPSTDPPTDPPTEPWKRVIKGISNILEPYPPEDIDVYPGPENPPVDEPAVEDPPTDPPVDPPTDDTGTTPPIVLPPIGGLGTGMNNVYNPTKAELQEFNAFLWSNDFVDTIKKILNDPMEAVIALQMVYCTPTTTSGGTIVVGSIDTEVSSDIVTNQFVTINCGSVTIPEYFQDYTDYSPYTEVIAYLPFIGFVNLETDDIIGSTVSIKYTVDLFTGTCLCEITVSKNNLSGVIYTFNGNCAVQLPLTAATHSSIFGVLTGMSTAAAGIATGNPLLFATGAAKVGLSAGKQSISRSGSLGSNAGAMGIKKPYLLVRRPVAYNPQRYNKYYGIPSSTTVLFSTLKGYTRVSHVHVENIESATDNEKKMIEDILKTGVIIG